MLDQVGHALLIIVFQNRTGLDDQPQLRAFLRFLIAADVIAHAVREFADADLGIDRHRRC